MPLSPRYRWPRCERLRRQRRCAPSSAGREPQGGALNELREKAARLPATHLPAELRYLLDRATFFFCRDTISLGYLKSQGVKTPVLEFGPDGQLGMHLRDDA